MSGTRPEPWFGLMPLKRNEKMKISAAVAYELADFARSRSRYGYEVGTADPTTFLSSEASDIVSSLVRSFLTTVKVIDPALEEASR